jgi:hypothetical protein
MDALTVQSDLSFVSNGTALTSKNIAPGVKGIVAFACIAD